MRLNSYRWLRRRYLRSTIKMKKSCFFILYCAHLIVPLATPKVLAFDNKNEKKLFFHFVLCSLNRTVGFAEGTCVRQ